MVRPITLYCQLNSWHCLLLFLFLSSLGFSLHCSSYSFSFLFFFFFCFLLSLGSGFWVSFLFFFFFFFASSQNFLVWSCTPWLGKDGFGVSKYPHKWVSKYPFLEHGDWGLGVVSQPRPWTKISHRFYISWWTKTVDCGWRPSPYRFCIGSSSSSHRHRLRWRWN